MLLETVFIKNSGLKEQSEISYVRSEQLSKKCSWRSQPGDAASVSETLHNTTSKQVNEFEFE